jgi:hypothetical protein
MTDPGWFADPDDSSQLRYWDGARWTEHRHPAQAATPTEQQVPGPESSAQTGQPSSNPGATAHWTSGIEAAAAIVQAAPGGRFSGKRACEEENQQLRQALGIIGVAEMAELENRVSALREEVKVKEQNLASVQAELVAVTDEVAMQTIGIYEYRHPLDSSAKYHDLIADVRQKIKSQAKTPGQAVTASTNWTVNDSLTQGRKMVKDFSQLMLRAYNNEADNAVRSMRPYKLDAAIKRLDTARRTIGRLGKTMNIEITDQYHYWRIRELEYTADYQEMLAREKDAAREEKQRLREEATAQKEFQREKDRLVKERTHYENAIAKLREAGNDVDADEAQAKLEELKAAIEGVDYRAANIRAGYVYVISNVGAFGPDVVKIGLTRRLEPLDRVRELGDASVPFRFDVHALVFSNDAVGLETALHQALQDKKLNMINQRREFFYATPQEVKVLLAEQLQDNSLVQYEEEPDAEEYRQSRAIRGRLNGPKASDPDSSGS